MRPFAIVTAYICTSLIAFAASAQEQPKTPPAAQQPPYSYVPELSELMITTQLRHFKLSYAGRVSNWPLATYEASLVRRSLNTAATLYPVFQNVQQAKLIAETSGTALNAIDRSIKDRDRDEFVASFKTLTNACNSCHQQANRDFIVIREPTSEHFNNQTFPLNNQQFIPKRR